MSWLDAIVKAIGFWPTFALMVLLLLGLVAAIRGRRP